MPESKMLGGWRANEMSVNHGASGITSVGKAMVYSEEDTK
jgi:hypothetical protein